MSVDRFDKPDAPQRRRPPFAPGRQPVGASVRKPLAHVVQQQIRVREDDLSARRAQRVVVRRFVARDVAGDAIRRRERARAALDFGVVRAAHGGDGENAGVERHFGEPLIRNLRRAAVRRGLAGDLRGRAGFHPAKCRMLCRRRPETRRRSVARPWADSLPPEPTERGRGGGARVPNHVGASRHPVPVRVLRVCEREYPRFGDGFE